MRWMCAFLSGQKLNNMLAVTFFLALSTRVTIQEEKYVSPFFSTGTDYKDFETRLLILESRYCGDLCGFDLVPKRMHGNQNCDRCSCDDMCHVYGDCCPDVSVSDTNSIDSPCINASVKADDLTKTSYRMTTSCPAEWPDDDVRRACARPKDDNDVAFYVPVTDVPSRITYKNRYCAECNTPNATTDWELQAMCRNSSVIFTEARSAQELFSLAKATIGCNVVSEPVGIPESATRTCVPSNEAVRISACNVTGMWSNYDPDVERACSLYARVVLGIYKNMFCRICNGDKWLDMLEEHTNPPFVNFGSISLTALIRFGNKQKPDVGSSAGTAGNTDSVTKCNRSQIYDASMCGCRDVLCADGKHLTNNTCISYVQKSNTIGYRLCFSIAVSLTSRPGEDVDQKLKALLTKIGSTDLQQTWNDVIITESVSHVTDVYGCGDAVHVYVQTQLSMYSPHVRNHDQLQNSLFQFVSLISQAFENRIGGDVRFSGRCFTTTMSAENSGQFDTKALRFICHFPSAVSLMDLIQYVKYIDFNKFLNCPHVMISRDYSKQHDINVRHSKCTTLFRSVNSDKNGITDGGDIKMCVEDFTACNESLCANNTSGFEEMVNKHTATPLGILSVVCTGVSLVFLVITFIVYSLFRELRTTGGVCNMGLVVNMSLAQVFYEFGMEQNENPVLCSIIGALIHFFWLTVILWMNVCVVQFFLKLCFPIKSLSIAAGTRNTFVIACVYSYGISFLAVGITILTHELILGDVGYGGNICYFSTQTGQIFAFVLPVGLITVSNIVMFTVTVVQLRRRSLTSSGKDHRIGLLACVKLSSLTGLAWIFAYLYTASSVTSLAYVFTVLVGGQGFFLFLALMVNGRVLQLVRGRRGTRKQSKYMASHSCSQTTSTDTRM